MKELSIIQIVCILMVFFGKVHADDSIPTKELKEVEVIGERAWIGEDGTLNFIPTRKEKRLSNSPASLIGSMHIPVLKEKDGSITTVSGEPVAVFINGIRAEAIDISTFWPSDVKAVKYIDNPKDPIFEGSRHVVNFIMRQYASGGVSKTDLVQKIPNLGYYTTSAKLVYKKMTFGAFLQGIYSRDHQSSTEGETKYSDIYYDGVLHDEITSNEISHDYKRNNTINTAINARYATEGFTATHTLSLSWMQDPGSGSESTQKWTDNLFHSDMSSAHFSDRKLSPQVSGNYYRRFSDKWHLSWRWGYAHAVNNSKSNSQTGDTETIVNESHENIDRLNLSLNPTYILSSKLYFQMSLNTTQNWFSTLYSGSANERQRQTRNESAGSITVGWTPLRSLRLTFRPGILYTQWNVGDVHEHILKPTATVWANWTPTQKFNISGNIQFLTTPPEANESNPVMVKSTELVWTKGNPYLRNADYWETHVRASYTPVENLMLAPWLTHVRTDNEIVPWHEAATPEAGGIIKSFRNADHSDNIMIGLPISWTCLGDNLSLEISPEWEYTRAYNEQKKSFDCFYFSAEADYTLGNCRFEVSYTSPYQGLYSAGMERTRRQDSCSVAFVYGNDNLYLKVEAENIFHSKSRYWTRLVSGCFSSDLNSFETGRRLALSLSYTFGFGKKVDKSIDISRPESVSSSVGTYK